MKRFFRSRRHRMIGGVCGGLGEYFDIDPAFIRLGFVLLSSATLVIYIIAWLIVPEQPA